MCVYVSVCVCVYVELMRCVGDVNMYDAYLVANVVIKSDLSYLYIINDRISLKSWMP